MLTARSLLPIALFTALLHSSCGGESVLAIGVDGGAGLGGTGGATGGIGGIGGTGATSVNGGTGGTSGTGGTNPFGCDVDVALMKSCGRSGCHSETAHYAGLVFTTSAVGPSLVDAPATHSDIDCAQPGEMFRPCTPAELPATCPPNALLIDSANVEASWILRKLDPAFVEDSCGIGMPAAPGNSASSGWTEERRLCLQTWIRWVAGGSM